MKTTYNYKGHEIKRSRRTNPWRNNRGWYTQVTIVWEVKDVGEFFRLKDAKQAIDKKGGKQ